MNPDYTIRRAAPDDAGVITQHRRRMFTDMGDQPYIQSVEIDAAYQRWLHPKLADETYQGWLVMCGGQIIGGAGIEIRERPPHPVGLMTRCAYIVNVYVEPDYRQQGIARELLRTLLAWCAEQGLRLASLHASTKGRPLYESLGFTASNEMRLPVI